MCMTLSEQFVVTQMSTQKIAKLHKNLHFTLERRNIEGDLRSFDINVNVSSGNNITSHWYQKTK